jgi:hypothetical protein
MELRHKYFIQDLSLSGDLLYNFIHHLPHPWHIKEVKTGQYILSNQANVKIYGLRNPDEIIGLTVHDLNHKMQWGMQYIDLIEQLDQQTKKRKQVMLDNDRVLVGDRGLLRLQTMVKVPLKGLDERVKAILTYSYNVVDRLTDLELFTLYLKQYQKKREAIKYFLTHLNINRYFNLSIRNALPSMKQVLVLIALSAHRNYKNSAKTLNISYKTLESHIVGIKNKLVNVGLDQIVFNIRNRKKT